jgi:transcriptional regulator with XRE-family HTH domain
MNQIGKKIKEIRKQKGLTQEELSDLAKINLRTIQRIENNENEPRGTTLNLICQVLDIKLEDILDYGKEEDKNYLIFFNLSVLIFLVIPLGNIIIPLTLWLNKKDKIIGLKEVGTKLLNFQILWTIITYGLMIGFSIFKILLISNSNVLFYLFSGFYLLNIILPIVYSIRIKKGKSQYYFPNSIKFIR